MEMRKQYELGLRSEKLNGMEVLYQSMRQECWSEDGLGWMTSKMEWVLRQVQKLAI